MTTRISHNPERKADAFPQPEDEPTKTSGIFIRKNEQPPFAKNPQSKNSETAKQIPKKPEK